MEAPAFAAVEAASPLHDALGPIRELIAGDPRLRVGAGATVRAEVRPRRTRAGGIELSRCYWSVQRTDHDAPFGFTARTLYWERHGRTARVFEFPDKPEMDWLRGSDGPLTGNGEHAPLRVLRYIPLRRVTFLLEHASGLPDRVIGKSKSRHGLLRATRALVGARRAVELHAAKTFRVPRPIRLDVGRHVLYVDELPGRDLEALVEAGLIDGVAALGRLGHIHCELHELELVPRRVRRNADWLSITAREAEPIAALAPSAARRLDALLARLAGTVPDDGELSFCQGDFVPSQVLSDPTGWAVLDFDDSHHADPYSEIAALYIALGWELPHPTPAAVDAARRAYLAGYLERARRPLDPARWEWFLAVAQVRYLARRMVKGRARPDEAATVLAGLEAGAIGGR